MSSLQLDVVTVGGGLGASAFAMSMAKRGARVLILEKETRFKDRVRGEFIVTWGVTEARELGIEDLLLKTCAKEIPWVDMGFGPRNLLETTPQQLPSLAFPHPAMQEALLAEAERAGAKVWRGVIVQSVEPGYSPSVVVSRNGKEERISARLVVAADGRGSATRKWAGFTSERNVQPFQFSGVLLTGVSGRQDIGTFIFNPEHGLIGALIPQRGDRFRAYLGYPNAAGALLQGAEKLSTFLNESRKVGSIFADCYAQAKAEGPLATFDGGDSWVKHPYRSGVALVGDAAATSDPSFGQGMALTLRDARVLRDALLSNSDWDQAGHLYAQQHDTYFHNIHTVCCWFRNIFQEQTPQAAVLRQKALPLLADDLSRVPDQIFGGPELPLNETVRARFFGEC